jgi:hypothetical protein
MNVANFRIVQPISRYAWHFFENGTRHRPQRYRADRKIRANEQNFTVADNGPHAAPTAPEQAGLFPTSL